MDDITHSQTCVFLALPSCGDAAYPGLACREPGEASFELLFAARLCWQGGSRSFSKF